MDRERRKHARIAFHASASLILADRTLEVLILDLSLKGALVRLPDGTAIDGQAPCRLCMQLDEMLAEIVMEMRLVHLEGCCAGLACLSIDLDSVTHLRRLVELNLGNPALLDRELSDLIVA